jgi:hypothetical protein
MGAKNHTGVLNGIPVTVLPHIRTIGLIQFALVKIKWTRIKPF